MRIAVAALLLLAALAATAQDRALYKQARVKAPVDAVWKAWTTSEGITSFFAPGAKVEARVGGAFSIHMNPLAPDGQKGADDMVILALQDKRMVSFTWNAPPHLPEVRAQRTYVTVRMKPASDNETDVTLFHGGWGDGGQWDQAYAYFDRAWGNVLKNLEKRFEENKPYDWEPWMKQLRDMMEKQAAEKK